MDSDSLALKRKCTSQHSPSPKRRLIVEPSISILNFSDCILLEILKYLDTTSLYCLSLTCRRFSCLVEDQSFWLYVDGRRRPNTKDKIEFCWKHVNEKTKHLLLSADSRDQFIFSPYNVFKSNTLSNLTVLSLEHQYIKYTKLNDFPHSLEEISFRHSFIARHACFFRFSEKAMSNLKTLILDHCQWFEGDCLTSLCKYPKLEILSLYMCKKLGEDDIANISLAGRFGFKSLKVLDLRFTGFGDLFMKTFCTKPTVQIVYFQCITTTYNMERYQRQLDIMNGASVDENSYMSDDDANDTTAESLEQRFHATKFQKYETLNIKDTSMVLFAQLKKVSDKKRRPKSVLYRYPYTTCTCLKKTKEVQNETFDSKQLRSKLQLEQATQKKNCEARFSNNIHFFYPDCKTICGNIIFDSCLLPYWCHTEATATLPVKKWLHTREPKTNFEITMLENTDKYLQSRVFRRCTSITGCDCRERDDPNMDPLHAYNTDISTIHRGSSREISTTSPEYFFMKILSNGIILLKSCPNPKTEAKNLTKTFVEEFCKELKLDDSEILKDTAFLDEISSTIYEISRKIAYDVESVMIYHITCLEILQCLTERQKAPKENLRSFFYNLLVAETKEDLGKLLSEPPDADSAKLLESEANELSESNYLPEIDLDEDDQPEFNEVVRQLVVVNRADVKVEKNPTAINELSFRGYSHITDATLTQLRDLELELLDVTGTNVTEQGAKQFLDYNPQCWLIHESVCMCRPNLHF